ncbi:g10777 [Coccomyxa viridis]|uniref:G10777 protein n=1 Tax=Coccomyxa viridis TaxID=1274662 RepID=A0ABP1GD98_9CHLO
MQDPVLQGLVEYMQDMDGRQLVVATHPTLASVGIASKLQRMQLLNRRDELLLLEDDHQEAPHQHGAHVTGELEGGHQDDSAARLRRSLDISRCHVSWTTDREQELVRVLTFNGTTLEEEMRKVASASALPVINLLIQCDKAAKAALYHGDSCSSFVSAAEELQAVLLSGNVTHLRPGFLLEYEIVLQDALCIFTCFSSTGWLGRVETSEGDAEAFQGLRAALDALARKQGICLHRRTITDIPDATLMLKGKLASVGGLKAFRAKAGHSPGFALHALEQVMSKKPDTDLAEEVAFEAEWAEAAVHPGPHSLIRQPDMRLFWWRTFGSQEEVTWDIFWSRFPKDLNREAGAGLVELFIPKANREAVQRALNRGNALMVTAVEIDFAFAADRPVSATCKAILSAANLWRSIGRGRSQETFTPAINTLPLECESNHLIDMDSRVAGLVSTLRSAGGQLQALHLTGPPGAGKVTAGLAAARQLLSCAHWEAAYFANLSGCVSPTSAAFAILSAFGVPSESADASLLLAWLSRNMAMPAGCLLSIPPDLPQSINDHIIHLLQRLIKVAPQLQMIVCREEALDMPRLSTAETCLPPLPDDAAFQLLVSGASKDCSMEVLHGICAACTDSPLLLQLCSRALQHGLLSPAELLSCLTNSSDDSDPYYRLLRAMAGTLEEQLVYSALLLAQFTAPFGAPAAAEMLHLAGREARARGTLAALTRLGLLSSHGRGEAQTWTMHACIRDAACSLAEELGISHLAAKAAMVEHHRHALMGMIALHGANAPISAARLLDRCQAHVLEALAWALDSPPPPALHAYAAILWHCTPLLLPRLDISQRMALCQAVQSQASEAGQDLELAQALWQLGCVLSDQARWADALAPLRQSLLLMESLEHSDTLDIACVCNALAVVHYKLGELEQSQDLYARAYDIQVMQLGGSHADVATTMANTAGLLKALGKQSEAEIVYRTVLEMREAALGRQHPEVAACLNNLAVLLKTMGRHAEAQGMYERCIAIKEQAMGPTHPQVALSLANLAALMQAQGRTSAAEELVRRALSIREDALGPDHPLVASSYAALSALLRAGGRRAEALTYAQVALEAKQRAFGPQHAEAAAAMLHLADILRDLGRYEEAARSAQGAAAVLESEPGAHLANVATALLLEAAVALCRGDAAAAEVAAQRALGIRKQAHGAGSKEAAAAMGTLSDALRELGRHKEAEEMAVLSLEAREFECGAESLAAAASLQSLALVMLATGRAADAEAQCQRCLKIRIAKGGEGSLETAAAQQVKGAVLKAIGEPRLKEAEAAYAACLASREQKLGQQHPDTAIAMLGLGEVKALMGNTEEAKPMLQRAYSLLLRCLGASHPHTARAYKALHPDS